MMIAHDATQTHADRPGFELWLSRDLKARYALSDALPGEFLALIDQADLPVSN